MSGRLLRRPAEPKPVSQPEPPPAPPPLVILAVDDDAVCVDDLCLPAEPRIVTTRVLEPAAPSQRPG